MTVPVSRSIVIGTAFPQVLSSSDRGTALHLALRTYLTRSDLAEDLPLATGLDPETLALVAERANALNTWLSEQGYTEFLCEIPVLGHTPQGAEIPGVIDLLAVGPQGCLVIDHKSGGAGEGVGPHWPQLSSYADLASRFFPQHRLQGAAVFWIDHGRLELVDSTSFVASFS